jgi:hypothetical protein
VPGRHPDEKRRAAVDEHSDDVRAAFLVVVAFLNCIYVNARAPGGGSLATDFQDGTLMAR